MKNWGIFVTFCKIGVFSLPCMLTRVIFVIRRKKAKEEEKRIREEEKDREREKEKEENKKRTLRLIDE